MLCFCFSPKKAALRGSSSFKLTGCFVGLVKHSTAVSHLWRNSRYVVLYRGYMLGSMQLLLALFFTAGNKNLCAAFSCSDLAYLASNINYSKWSFFFSRLLLFTTIFAFYNFFVQKCFNDLKKSRKNKQNYNKLLILVNI